MLKKAGKDTSIPRKKKVPVVEEVQKRKKNLAELYTERAALHLAAGRAHHAIFDVEEALRTWPECSEAVKLLEKLKNASDRTKSENE